jgi:hypothetical protein
MLKKVKQIVNIGNNHDQGSRKRKKASLMRAEAQCGGLPHRLYKRLSRKKWKKRGKSAAYARWSANRKATAPITLNAFLNLDHDRPLAFLSEVLYCSCWLLVLLTSKCIQYRWLDTSKFTLYLQRSRFRSRNNNCERKQKAPPHL